jgi:hypothetical protein
MRERGFAYSTHASLVKNVWPCVDVVPNADVPF